MARHRMAAAWWTFAAAGLLAIPGCGGGGGGGGGGDGGGFGDGTGSVSGRVVPGDSPFTARAVAARVSLTFREVEPNDAVDQLRPAAALADGVTVSISGETTALDASDPFDGYQVTVPAPVSTTATLTTEGSLDADLAVFDVETMSVEVVVPATSNRAQVTFVARGTVDLVVRATTGAGAYVLTVEATGPAPADAAATGARPLAALSAESARWRRAEAAAPFGLPRERFAPGKALVGFRAGEEREGRAALEALGYEVLEENPSGPVVIALPTTTGADAVTNARETASSAHRLRSAAGMAYCEPSFRRTASATTPDDPRWRDQWDLPLIRCPEAWDMTKGASSVIVAVIDTGRTDHPDLSGRQSGGYDFISDAATAGDGNGRDADPTDVGDSEGGEPSSFHGTHVAGTIGAASNNGVGVAGVTWATTIMHLRVLGKGGGEDADIIAAILYAAGLPNATGKVPAQRADVINMSLGGGGYDQAFQDAITRARDAGVVIFAAAGNDGTTAKEYPASFDGVVSVAAVDRNKRRTSYSNRNSAVDIAAPGGDQSRSESDGVLSTVYDDSGSGAPVATYAYYEGTSMATPHAAAVAALVRSVNPSLTPAQVEDILFTTAEDLGTSGRDNDTGWGLVDAHAAVVKAGGSPNASPLLSLSPGSLAFAGGMTSQDVAVANAGGGKVTVSRVDVSTASGGSWLSAATFGTGDATRSVDGVRVRVSPGALADGTYDGTVTVVSDGGTRTVSVSLEVGDGGGGGGGGAGGSFGDSDVFVLAVDPDTYDTVDEIRIRAGEEPRFTFGALPAGSYLFVAGSDDNDDGWLGDPGEWYGESSEIVDVFDGDRVTGVEIFVTSGSSIALGSYPPRFRVR